MREFFKQLFCKHKYIEIGKYKLGYLGLVELNIKYCTKCGRLINDKLRKD